MHMQISNQDDPTSAGDISAVWSQVAAFATAMDASLGKWLTSTRGIGLTDYRALAQLSQASAKELRVNELAQRIGLNQSSVTRLVSRLEEKDLVDRDTCPDDGRGVYAVITARGETLFRDLRGTYNARVRELLGNMDKHFPELEPHQLAGALRKISDLASP
ncbi:MarR family winged helix-turn-helix transcriptional regulator [Arthrobacter sp. TMN-49]